VSEDPLLYVPRNYTVAVPLDYTWDDGICTDLRFDSDYRPPFVSAQNLAYIRQGMRLAVTAGTAQPANLPVIEVAGTTGTAEYCDILGFIYNGGEGSATALPMVMETMEAYLRLKEQRNSQPANIPVEANNP
jgi:cell division protein FtsI/penicillin-binding protein 2